MKSAPAAMLEGVCPRCDGRRGGQGSVFACISCNDRGVIPFPPAFSHDEDDGLALFVTAGRPLSWIALTLLRPKRVILERMRELHLDEPPWWQGGGGLPAVRLATRDGQEIDIHDGALDARPPKQKDGSA